MNDGRPLSALALVGLLTVAACGDDTSPAGETTTSTTAGAATSSTSDASGGATAPTTTDTTPVALTASWPGVTEDTIRLGFPVVDFPELREMGVVDIDVGDPQLVVDTFVDEINARGGILGRRLEASVELVLPLGTTDAEAACLRLTEDVDVFAVLGPFAGPAAEANTCITDLHETIMIGGRPTPDQLAVSRAPWITEVMSSERHLVGAVTLLEDADLIGERVAVAVDASETSLADGVVIPALEAAGHQIVQTAVQDGGADVQAREANWDTFVERFRADDPDTVVLIESTALGGANRIRRSDLDVGVVLVDTQSYVNILTSLEDASSEELEGIVGTTAATSEEAWELPATQACVDVFEAAHPDLDVIRADLVPDGEPSWISTVLPTCTRLWLFEMIATAAGPDLTHDTFVRAAESLGEIELPGQLFASLGPDKHDAADALRLSAWDPTADDGGGAVPYGPLTRIDR